MDAVPQLPAYAHLDREAVQCIAQASQRYKVPELLIHAVILKEDGRMGQCSKNKNGTYDCGLAQINTAWRQYFEKKGIDYGYIVHHKCTNIHASGYILADNYSKKQDWFKAIVAYNIGPAKWTPERYAIGHKYASDVVSRWWGLQKWVTGASSTSVHTPRTQALTRPIAPLKKEKAAILEFAPEETSSEP